MASDVKDNAAAAPPAFPTWLLTILLVPVGLALGFASGSSLSLLVGATAAFLALGLFGTIRLAVPIKLIFLLIAVTFLQKVLGYVRASEVRGLNVGNLLLAATLMYWLLSGVQRGGLYRPSPIDFWLFITVIVIPVASITFTLAYRKVPGYTLASQLPWYKQWVTPFIYFFLLCQCLEKKRDIRHLFFLILFLVGCAVLEGMPEVMRFSNWRESRSEGIVGQANDYAALLANAAPFLVLVVLLYRERPFVRILSLLMLGCMGISLLTTFSRAGYIGFGVAILGGLYVAYKSTGKIAVIGPAILLSTLCLFPIVTVPQILDSLQTRFATETYKRAKRKSYSKYDVTNQYSGGRLEIWNGALHMAEDYPIFGVGFHAFELELPRYHYLAWSNYPHNQFLGALAEGGILFLTALCVLYWKLLRLLYHNWKVVLKLGDKAGQLVCGGALVSFIIMILISLTNDFMNPGPKTTIFWVMMAGAIRYSAIARDDETVPAQASA
jgi:O-antigen ligase